MAASWSKGRVPASVDPLIYWRLVEMADFLPPEPEESRWWSAQIELRDISLDQFRRRLAERSGLRPESLFHLPEIEPEQTALPKERQVATAYGTLPFFELVFDEDNQRELGIERVVLGRVLPKRQRNFEASFGPGKAMPGGPARAIVAVIDDGIAFAHELFRRCDGSRVEFAWIQDGTPANRHRGRELDRAEIESLLQRHSHGGRLDEAAFYRDAGLIDFSDGLHKSAAFRRSHGTHVAALAAGHAPGTHDEDYPLILVQLPATVVEDSSGDWIGPDLAIAIEYILQRARQIDKARQAGGMLPLVINFSFGNFAGSHDGTDMLERLLDQVSQAGPRPVRVVLPAGNGHLSRCHAVLAFDRPGQSRTLSWHVLPDDRTASYVEIWLPHRGPNPPDLVQVEVTSPCGRATALVEATPGPPVVVARDGATIGQLHYRFFPAPTERGRIMIALLPTAHETARPLAPSGVWRITVTNKALRPEEQIHLRIQRDDSLAGYPLRGRQSYFEDPAYRRFDGIGRPLETEPEDPPCPVKRTGTLNAFATGRETVVVGGYVRGSGAPAPESGAGPVTPTRDARTPHRAGPEALAASDDSPVQRGTLAAGSWGGSMVALNGTSVAAPQVARWLADELAAGRSGDRAAVRDKAQADEQNRPEPGPPETRGGGGRLTLPRQPFRPRRLVPDRP
ncbi:MAG: S8 family serine peptidase [Tistlia sp.]|uniref:S8 family serine peptidase n=1 Tax=Tistlia sp. TaxID=3057121 RepID=UPI0034A4C01B